MIGAACAHRQIDYRTIEVGAGAVRGEWACKSCDELFWPSPAFPGNAAAEIARLRVEVKDYRKDSDYFRVECDRLRQERDKAEAVVLAALACEEDIKRLEAVEANVDDGYGPKLRRLREYVNELATFRGRAC